MRGIISHDARETGRVIERKEFSRGGEGEEDVLFTDTSTSLTKIKTQERSKNARVSKLAGPE